MDLKDRWLALLHRMAPGRGDAGVLLWHVLESLYHWPPRAYHNLGHVRAVLAIFDEVTHEAQQPLELEFALFLHDAVYIPGRGDNEDQSAAIATMFLRELAIGDGTMSRIDGLIIATMHSSLDLTGDAALIADIDMAVLGAPESEYELYAQAIAAEHASAGAERYRAGRRGFLAGLLARPDIFHGMAMRERFEAMARENIARELSRLSGTGGDRDFG
jgi:predicted metal-dependent HD superfamily phosphohydrolase